MTSHPRIQFYFILTLIVSIFYFGSTRSEAAPSSTLEKRGFSRSQQKPFSISAAISSGTATIDEPGMDTSGNQTEIKLVGTYSLSSVNFEVGGGYFRNQVSGKARRATTDESLYLSQYGLTTEATLFTTAIRGRPTERIEVGPVLELLLGPDVGFSAGFGKSGITSVWLAGAEALYALPLESFVAKVGARYLTSTNLENRLSSIQATLQFGVPLL